MIGEFITAICLTYSLMNNSHQLGISQAFYVSGNSASWWTCLEVFLTFNE